MTIRRCSDGKRYSKKRCFLPRAGASKEAEELRIFRLVRSLDSFTRDMFAGRTNLGNGWIVRRRSERAGGGVPTAYRRIRMKKRSTAPYQKNRRSMAGIERR